MEDARQEALAVAVEYGDVDAALNATDALVLAIGGELIVVAFHHQRRDPDYWHRRLAKVRA